MPEPINLDDLALAQKEMRNAFGTLRDEVRQGTLTPEKQERIDKVLDSYDADFNSKIVAMQQAELAAKDEVKQLKTALDDAGVKAGEQAERLDSLEAEIVRRGKSNPADPHDSDEWKAMKAHCVGGMANTTLEEKALLQSDVAVSGGVLTTTEMDSEIVKEIEEIDPIRTVARVTTTSAKSLEIPKRTSVPTALWEGEAEAAAESVSVYASEVLTPFRLTHIVPITVDLLQDSAFNMEAEIFSDSAIAFGVAEGAGFVTGSGFKEPEGFLSNSAITAVGATGALETATASTTVISDVLLLTGRLKTGYANPSFALTRLTLAVLRTETDSAGGFLLEPGINGLVASTLAGHPYVLAPNMGVATTNADFPVAFGDFRSGYTILDRTGISVVRDDVTAANQAIVKFTLRRWLTGKVILPEAIKVLKVASS